ncbi:MAG: DUF6438 domain-containing protein [Gemmatimonas sp.]
MMRASGVGLAALMLTVASAGCKKSASVDAVPVDSSLVASLERGPCHGTCPVYRVEIYGDGKVRFEGKQHVGDMGIRNGTTTTAAIQSFMRSVAATAFSSADTSFIMESAGCGAYATDLPTAVLSIKVGARMKTIQHDFGCRNAPPFLRTLEAQLDTAARTAPWIAGTGEKK